MLSALFIYSILLANCLSSMRKGRGGNRGLGRPPFHRLGSGPAPSLPCPLLQALAHFPPSPYCFRPGSPLLLRMQPCAPPSPLPPRTRAGGGRGELTYGGRQRWRVAAVWPQLATEGGRSQPCTATSNHPPRLPASLPPLFLAA